ncbi:MAG: hypothetical protein RL685_1558 [Pseudomonadota bacterium]|jgi:hypothetical protein
MQRLNPEESALVTAALVLGAVTLVATACGATAEQLRDRDLCYERAESAAQRRVDVECEGMGFAECPGSRAILEDLRKQQEACP